MGNTHSQSSLESCIQSLAGNRALSSFAAFPGSPTYKTDWARLYNLNFAVVPAAVARPETAEDVAGLVKCARENGVRVQAKSGGHSYGNYGLGGVDGVLSIDMVNFQHFSMDNDTGVVTVGAGMPINVLNQKLQNAGGRAIPHGIAPGIGIGGHAGIGGIGTMSRMWGTTLDHVIKMQVVTADGEIRTVNKSSEPDLFWALRGAAPSFGIITSLTLITHPAPSPIAQYETTLSFSPTTLSSAPLYSVWQQLISDPSLDPRFGSLFILTPMGSLITGTFYGSQSEFEDSGIPERFPDGMQPHVQMTDWLGAGAHLAGQMGKWMLSTQTGFFVKSLAFRRNELPSSLDVQEIFKWIDDQDKGTILWFCVFEAVGGKMNEVSVEDTAFVHRDKTVVWQVWAVVPSMEGNSVLVDKARKFVAGLKDQFMKYAKGVDGMYPGYVDPEMGEESGQRMYWGRNLERLEELKRVWDPEERFWNPQSVRPADKFSGKKRLGVS